MKKRTNKRLLDYHIEAELTLHLLKAIESFESKEHPRAKIQVKHKIMASGQLLNTFVRTFVKSLEHEKSINRT